MSSAVAQALVLEAVVVVLVARRALMSYRGVRLSVPRLFVFPAIAGALFVFTEYTTVIAVPWSYPVYLALTLLVLAAALLGVQPYARDTVRLWVQPDGSWRYQLGVTLIVTYLVIWIVRFALEVVFDPGAIVAPGTPVGLSAVGAEILLGVQFLYAASTGLLIGRSVGVYRAYQAARTAPAPGALPSASHGP